MRSTEACPICDELVGGVIDGAPWPLHRDFSGAPCPMSGERLGRVSVVAVRTPSIVERVGDVYRALQAYAPQHRAAELTRQLEGAGSNLERAFLLGRLGVPAREIRGVLLRLRYLTPRRRAHVQELPVAVDADPPQGVAAGGGLPDHPSPIPPGSGGRRVQL